MIERQSLTQAAFWDLLSQDTTDGATQYELIDGAIIEMPPASAGPSTIAARLNYYLTAYLIANDEPGFLTSADGGFELDAQTVLVPDVGYISKQRQPELPERFFPQAPNLAIEVVSPTDRVKKVQQKALRYLQAGTQAVWIVYPAEKAVDVCHLAEDGGLHIREVGIAATLDGEGVLPGFSLPVTSIFPG